MGTGHIMRCLALAQAWQDTGRRVAFACNQITAALEQRLAHEKIPYYHVDRSLGELHDATKTAELASSLSADCVVIDGYQFSSEYQQFVKERTNFTIVIDDYGHCPSYTADVLLNQNISAGPRLYSSSSKVGSFLLGTSYALLRREFLELKHAEHAAPKVARKLLITLGGSDEDNFTGRVLDQLDQISSPIFDITLVAGGSNPHVESLSEKIPNSSHRVKLLVDVKDMARLMQVTDLAICAGGSSNWELSYFGVPRVLLILAENQIEIARGLTNIGAGVLAHSDLSNLSSIVSEVANDAVIRERLALKSRSLVDGLGAQRVVQVMQSPRSCTQ